MKLLQGLILQVYFILQLFIQLSVANPTRNKYASLAKCLNLSSPSTATADQILTHLTLWQYSMVSLTSPLPRRKTRSAPPKSSNCPYTWEIDDDQNRQPRILLKAKLGACPKSNAACTTNCHAVTYGHRVLKHNCTRIWTWQTVILPVAFVRV